MIKEQDGLIEHLEKIIENLDASLAKDIAKFAIDKGINTLSEKQKYVLEEGISDYLMYECPNCGEEISYEDMEISIDNGMCSYCSHKWDKMQKE
ncbi:hypothetical protein FJR45_06980 [Sulfurimonas sediminis]|uniref:Uncharacterized protein n=1 Tax=Sulfurimonas sediminis TaxID=2590020 RepID=A0A7M1B2G9_9BACT|nr:hypothetical protein [Sulfurimonas sediminis]QOP43706.1 hypothetical protein FJR45_06980 [Sulfurimonas sediminis]